MILKFDGTYFLVSQVFQAFKHIFLPLSGRNLRHSGTSDQDHRSFVIDESCIRYAFVEENTHPNTDRFLRFLSL